MEVQAITRNFGCPRRRCAKSPARFRGSPAAQALAVLHLCRANRPVSSLRPSSPRSPTPRTITDSRWRILWSVVRQPRPRRVSSGSSPKHADQGPIIKRNCHVRIVLSEK